MSESQRDQSTWIEREWLRISGTLSDANFDLLAGMRIFAPQILSVGGVAVFRAETKDDVFEPIIPNEANGKEMIAVSVIDGSDLADILAWPVDQPDRWYFLKDEQVDILGAENVPDALHWRRPLQVWRTPLRWLQEGGKGAVIIRNQFAPSVLLDQELKLVPEDIDHGKKLRRLLHQRDRCMPTILVRVD